MVGCFILGLRRGRVSGWLVLILMLSMACRVGNSATSPQAAGSGGSQTDLLSSTPSPAVGTAYQQTPEPAHALSRRAGRDNDIVFDRISLDEDSSPSVVMSIAQDSTGFKSPSEGYVPLALPPPAGILAAANPRVQ